MIGKSHPIAPFVAMPGAPSSVLVTTSKALVTRSDALVTSSEPFSFQLPHLALAPHMRQFSNQAASRRGSLDHPT